MMMVKRWEKPENVAVHLSFALQSNVCVYVGYDKDKFQRKWDVSGIGSFIKV